MQISADPSQAERLRDQAVVLADALKKLIGTASSSADIGITSMSADILKAAGISWSTGAFWEVCTPVREWWMCLLFVCLFIYANVFVDSRVSCNKDEVQTAGTWVWNMELLQMQRLMWCGSVCFVYMFAVKSQLLICICFCKLHVCILNCRRKKKLYF